MEFRRGPWRDIALLPSRRRKLEFCWLISIPRRKARSGENEKSQKPLKMFIAPLFSPDLNILDSIQSKVHQIKSYCTDRTEFMETLDGVWWCGWTIIIAALWHMMGEISTNMHIKGTKKDRKHGMFGWLESERRRLQSNFQAFRLYSELCLID